ncbi:unnamed protein product [Rotaria sp. Silwood1]|nr:unnamed protein product [Rotaria sp. Silwood1]CAF3824686.1 unnamed protein product [Rotaria sp. Silwood1]CAF3885746.1 unnamed protein product [Rotaria sp. Silwood1]CAF3943802.1 unnamed protein product [Rotaria sp. Silwood1]CAF4931358.1 unnamed protein product [Rotaria sp. Silwood1]
MIHLDLQKSSLCSTTITSPTTCVESSAGVDEVTTLLNSISSYFSVRPTKYGGRGCFANTDLPQGTIVHECSMPLSSTIVRPFRKEVCGSCFKYLDGKTLKFKLMSRNNKQNNSTSDASLALYFCSQSCMDKFIDLDIDDLYRESLLNVENLFIRGLNHDRCDLEMEIQHEEAEIEAELKLENALKQAKDIDLFISQKWQEAEINCQLQLSKLKPKQRKNFNNLIHLTPKIDENEYLEIKYIIGILFQMYKRDYCKNNKLSLSISVSLSLFELQVFQHLQSSDIQRICKYPYLLHSYTNKIYKFLKISTSEKLQPYITPSTIRSIIGKNLTNIYAIWSIDEPNGNKEYFGYSLYPSASFFNHSCNPNLMKIKQGAKIIFKLLKNIKKDEELCIHYGNSISDGLEIRRKYLKEWFFDCLCERCVEEMNLKNAKK